MWKFRKVRSGKDKRYYKIFDLLLRRLSDNSYFLFELKINETALFALKTIIDKKYYNYKSVLIHPYLLIGINLNIEVNNNKVTIAFLHRTINYCL